MPFMGSDWRSHGAVWIKTDRGWETISSSPPSKYFLQSRSEPLRTDNGAENLRPVPSRSIDIQFPLESPEISFDHQPSPPKNPFAFDEDALHQVIKSVVREEAENYFTKVANYPCLYLQKKSTNESVIHNSMENALSKLDFARSCRYLSRFFYIADVVSFWFERKLSDSGFTTTQMRVFSILEKLVEFVCLHCLCERQMMNVLTKIEDLISRDNEFYLSGPAKTKRAEHVKKLKGILENHLEIPLNERCRLNDLEAPCVFNRLPYKVLEQIVSGLSYPSDLCSLSVVNDLFYNVCNQEDIWKKMCYFHFGPEAILRTCSNQGKEFHWKRVFEVLSRKGTLKQTYGDYIVQCSYHKCMYWNNDGHVAKCEECEEISVEPKVFVQTFI